MTERLSENPINIEEKWGNFSGPEKQYWIARFLGMNETNKLRLVGQVMKLKYSKFEDLPIEFQKFLSENL